jgi:hypothetical protein
MVELEKARARYNTNLLPEEEIRRYNGTFSLKHSLVLRGRR